MFFNSLGHHTSLSPNQYALLYVTQISPSTSDYYCCCAMSPTESSPEPTLDSLRPSSIWTNDSAFADSAISMGTSTPKQFDDDQLELRSPISPRHNLSERLTQLAAIAWAAEQDGFLEDVTRERIFKATTTIENSLEDRDDESDRREVESSKAKAEDEAEREEEIAQLEAIHRSLAATVNEMRLRQQEQRHIHELTLQKLDDVAGTCATQEQRIRGMEKEIELLHIRNQKLRRDNEGFEEHAIQLTTELEQKDVALQAMSSAVAGLDGWIQNSFGPDTSGTRRVRATRGRGRFRTDYYVDVPIEHAHGQGLDGTVDIREVRDGITAWVRGFRDVEDAVNTGTASKFPVPGSPPERSGGYGPNTITDDDDWRDFQTVSSTREFD